MTIPNLVGLFAAGMILAIVGTGLAKVADYQWMLAPNGACVFLQGDGS